MKVSAYFYQLIVIAVLMASLLIVVGCGNDSGIQEPLLPPPPPAPAITPTLPGTPSFAVIRGNYFLLASDCPNDGSAMQIAQEQAGIFITGAFTFNGIKEQLSGFVDGDGLARFFGQSDIADANCTGTVAVDGRVRGSCTYLEAGNSESCRFVYGTQIAGVYAPVWNDCLNDGSDLTVAQDGDVITLTGGFDYSLPAVLDIHSGVIEAGSVLFNPTISDNCNFNVSGDGLQGSCRDVSSDPVKTCTFGYEDTGRTENIDLADDGLFPSPAVTPFLPTTPITDVSGVYNLVSNNCTNDGGSIEISQSGATLGFLGGFDYQSQSPDLYTGSLASNSTFGFSNLGQAEQAFCTGDILFDSQGASGISGTCTVAPGAGTCDFVYTKSN